MKPYIICHMMSLLDGRIDCDVTEQIESGNEYYDALNQLNCPSTLMGRVTMQMHYALPEPFIAEDKTPIGNERHHVAIATKGYLVAIDTMGKLSWPQSSTGCPFWSSPQRIVRRPITTPSPSNIYHGWLRERTESTCQEPWKFCTRSSTWND